MERERKYFPSLDYDPFNPLPYKLLEKEELLIKNDDDHHNITVNSADYCVRLGSLHIHQCLGHDNSDPFVAYLAMNFVDRYLSKNRRSDLNKPVLVGEDKALLFAICCFRLAWKTRNNKIKIPNSTNPYYHMERFAAMNIHEMELHILKELDWETRAVTPLCFVSHIEPKLYLAHGFKRGTINEIIIQTTYNLQIVRHKPSVIAASALLTASYFLYRRWFPSLVLQLLSEGFEEASLRICTGNMIEMCREMRLVIQGTKQRVRAVQRGMRSSEIEEAPDQVEEEEEEDMEGMEFGFEPKWDLFIEKDLSLLSLEMPLLMATDNVIFTPIWYIY